MKRAIARLAAALLPLALPAAVQAAADPVQPQAPAMEFTPPAAGSYTLQTIQRVPYVPRGRLLDHRGRGISLSEVTQGKVTLLTFFYTYCTDPFGCPFAFELMNGLRASLLATPARAARLRFVSISLDPANDSPEAVARHAGALADPRAPFEWRFLTPRSMAALLPLLEEFGQDVSVQRDEKGAPTRALNHMLKLFLIDGSGAVREIYALDYLHPAMMLNDIDTLLIERGDLPPPR